MPTIVTSRRRLSRSVTKMHSRSASELLLVKGFPSWPRSGRVRTSANRMVGLPAISVIASAAMFSLLMVGIGPTNAAVVAGSDGADQLVGTNGDDRIKGGKGNDSITAGSGTDLIDSGPGNDTVHLGPNGSGAARRDDGYGGRGDDRIFGDAGPDIISGGPGRNFLEGGPGRDWISSTEKARDVIDAGPGDDVVLAVDATYIIRLGAGRDLLQLDPNDHADTINCGPGRDIVEYVGVADIVDRLMHCEVVRTTARAGPPQSNQGA